MEFDLDFYTEVQDLRYLVVCFLPAAWALLGLSPNLPSAGVLRCLLDALLC